MEVHMKVLITGATGLIGRALCGSLSEQGHTVVALSRSPETTRGLSAAELHKWDPVSGDFPARALAGDDTGLHFAGQLIASPRFCLKKKKTNKEPQELRFAPPARADQHHIQV